MCLGALDFKDLTQEAVRLAGEAADEGVRIEAQAAGDMVRATKLIIAHNDGKSGGKKPAS